ncbi:MAG: hypothetical protein HC868_13765 [Sphingomonadales bacterium]|nr:hypothetical protein [Sphingomonadales bacterium]
MSNQGNPQPQLAPPTAIAARLVMAYMASQAVNVATKLGVADVLGKGALTSSDVARATQTRPDRMHRLLRALAAFDVVKDLGSGRFELTPVGDCLRADSPMSVRSLVLLLGSESYYDAMGSLDECVKTGQNAYQILYGLDSSFAYYEKHAEAGRIFDDAMSANSTLVGATAAKAYDFSGISHIVDVGGGQGKVLASILKVHPSIRGVLFDLPRVVEGARRSWPRKGWLTAARPWAATCSIPCRVAATPTCFRTSSMTGMTRTPPGFCRAAGAPWRPRQNCSLSTG